MLMRVLRSWQLLAAVAVVGFAVAAFAAVAEASGPDAPMPGDGFGQAPGTPAGVPQPTASEGEGGEGIEASPGSLAQTPPHPPAPDLWEVFEPVPAPADPPVGPLRSAAAPRQDEGAAPDRADDEQADPPAVEDEPAQVVATPVGVRIPTIDVDAPTFPLGLQANREIEVPQVHGETGWWRGGPSPGQPGPAVILGHVNSWEGPDVFSGLHALGPGEEVFVDLDDGSTVVYAVQAAALYLKEDFPTESVYLERSDTSLLRLVTCGGTLDRTSGSYDSNYIVFAEQIRIEHPDRRLDELA